MRRELTLPQQNLLLSRSLTPVGGSGSLSPTRLVWRYPACPGPLSRSYAIRLELPLGGLPGVFVEDPEPRVLSGGVDPPHIYRNPERLCLYMPGTGQWDATKRLDETVVPWTALWLTYFEDWLATKEWRGGGFHPDPGRAGRSRRERRRTPSAGTRARPGLAPRCVRRP